MHKVQGENGFTLEIQYASAMLHLPGQDDIYRWAGVAMNFAVPRSKPAMSMELAVRIVDEEEMTGLNLRYRRQEKPTNVLSFPCDMPTVPDCCPIGDIVICAPVVAKEAVAQGKETDAHWAHMVIHGVLHLLGFDHISHNQSEQMEAIETIALARLGFPDPYTLRTSEPVQLPNGL